jgi:hypothetical protein
LLAAVTEQLGLVLVERPTMPERLTAGGEPDKRIRTADNPYVAPEKPPAPGQRPEEITDRAGAILARSLADVAADIKQAKARYDTLIARRCALIVLANEMTVNGKLATDVWVGRFAGLSKHRIGEIRKKPPGSAKAE